MNSSRFSVPLIIMWLPVILFTVSLPLLAFVYEGSNGIEKSEGYELFLMGGTAILGGGLLEWLVWLANPLAFLALYYFRHALKTDRSQALRLSDRSKSRWMATIAMLLALSFRCWQEVQKNEAGSKGAILSFEWGYYIWASAMTVLCVGINYYFLHSRHTIKEQS